MSTINEIEINVFIHAIEHYFKQISNEIAIVKAAYLSGGEDLPPSFDYTGTISLSGNYRGSIYFSAPRIMMRHLLIAMNEPNRSEQDFLDAIGEIANTLAGNARLHFGEMMQISIPSTAAAPFFKPPELTREHPFVIMLKWQQYHASLVIDMMQIR